MGLSKQEKINLIVKYLKLDSRIPLPELKKKTGIHINTLHNLIEQIKEDYIFTIIEKNSKSEEYLDVQGWFD